MSQSLSPHHLCKRFLQQNWSDSFGILLARCSAKRPHEWIDESLNALIVRTVDKVHRARQLVVSREAPPEPAAQSTAQACTATASRSRSRTNICPVRLVTSGGAKKLWSPLCDSPRTGAGADAAGSVPRARISGRPVRTTSRPYYRHQADGLPRSVFFFPCRFARVSTSCLALTNRRDT